MISRFFIVSIFTIVTTILWAKTPENIKAIEKEITVAGCRFKMIDRYNGTLTVYEEQNNANYHAVVNPTARRTFDTWIQFSCESAADAKTISLLSGMRMTPKGWAIDPQSGYPAIKGAHTKFHALHGKGWHGGGVSMDDTDGDETRRVRGYGFCIIHEQVALCGTVRHVGYLQHLNESVLPQVIKMLNSIEFVDDPSATPARPVSSP
ncbi:hypothetical protein G3N59_08185 [Paraburkholderia sp. Ac-20340]|uniref:hypothetical protein n=1 Tax=Paraburkholderia sp. Ac-20340 TaxID=2703888 RepID=UPI00197EC629|nr:hypothetical protein [Paraburkholderia sp. Ac-20340]MBN3853351.1 hypothetical protein [Paraburkholderia sp. Ac-20340]